MVENFNKGCDKNPEDNSCRWELDALMLELGDLKISKDGLQMGSGFIKPKGRGIKYEVPIGETAKTLSKSDLARNKQTKNLLDHQERAADIRRRGVPITPEQYRQMHHEEDLFS